MAKIKGSQLSSKQSDISVKSNHSHAASANSTPVDLPYVQEKEVFASRVVAPKRKPKSKSQKAGLILPVETIRKKLIRGHYAQIIRPGAAVYLTAILEYLVAEIMEIGGNAAKENKKKVITPRHLTLAIRNDEELDKLIHGATIAQGGVIPKIHAVLLPKKTTRRSKSSKKESKVDNEV